jgi:RNA polymerase sigma factor for flagellar operon FliA
MIVKQKELKIRNDLILKHLYVVYTIVFKIQKKFNTTVDSEDLISIGTIGLINAVDNYKTEFGTKISTYARSRVYGAILDFFRSEDHLSRSSRTKVKKIEQMITYLEHEAGREVTSDEIANKLSISVETYYQHTLKTQQIFMDSIDISYEEDMINTLELEQDDIYNPDNIIHYKEFIQKFSKQILELSERERLIFCLYFYEGIPMGEIGRILGLQETRISQIIRKIISTIKINIEIRNWFKN